jgi:hypothetical protein
MVLDEIGRCVARIVLSPPSFIPVFIFLLATFPCDVSGFQDIIYEEIHLFTLIQMY